MMLTKVHCACALHVAGQSELGLKVLVLYSTIWV